MDWLLHNPIADMRGPDFLLLEAAVIVILLVEALRSRRRNDRTRALEPPPVPTKPDPRVVAYLRGGAQDLTRLVVFDLLRRGDLRLETPRKRRLGASLPQKIERAPDMARTGLKDPIERTVLEYFTVPRGAAELFQPNGLAKSVEGFCGPIAEALRDQELLSPPERYAAAWRVGLSGACLILALSGYKLWVAVEKGRSNFAFLIILTIVGLVAQAVVCSIPRLTYRGREYLKRLQTAFEGLKTRTVVTNEHAALSGTEPTMLLVPALFGVGALAGTEFSYVADLFKTSASSGGGGGCGGGCGGGGCGGGGCGGGCGGCGG